jgi:hypothetical protein
MMPIHDWTRVGANRFHAFHQDWSIEIARALNARLPEGYFALPEQRTGSPEPDVVTLSIPNRDRTSQDNGFSISEKPITTRHMAVADAARYAQKANVLRIHEPDGDVVAVIEIVSPGNKDSRYAMKSFTRKAVTYLNAGIHLLIVDLFPPSKRDPQGIHRVIWDRLRDDEFCLPEGKQLTVVSYSAGVSIRAFVEPLAVGDTLPDMPIFLTSETYIPCPLEETYQNSWNAFPKPLKPLLEHPRQ